MSKNCCIKKAVGKWKIWTIVSAVVLLVGVVLGIIFGLNQKASMGSYEALTVTVTGVSFDSEDEEVKSIIEQEIENAKLSVLFDREAEISNADKEYIYYFAEGSDLGELKGNVKKAIETAAAASGSKIESVLSVQVTANSEEVIRNTPAAYAGRAVIAIAVFAVLAFAYAWLRYKLAGGIVAAAAVALSSGLSYAVSVITRIPTDGNIVAVFAFAGLVAAVMTVFTLAKVRSLEKAESAKDMTEEEKVSAGLSVKSVFALAAALIGALVLLVAFGPSRWFAVHAILAVLVSTFVALIAIPAGYLPLKQALAKKKSKFSYKKAEKAVKEEATENE